MKPCNDALFGRSDRVGLLWALELLAWCPERLDRVVSLLAFLAELEPNDNLASRPSDSLQSIFRCWLPQTAAPLEHRIHIFDHLANRHPKIAWEIAISQFKPGPQNGYYSNKPKWRDYALGLGEPVLADEAQRFATHCIQTCIGWPSHTRETLNDLMGNAEMLSSNDLARLADLMVDWAKNSNDQDRAWLRESKSIRMSMQRAIRRVSEQSVETPSSTGCVLMEQKVLESSKTKRSHLGARLALSKSVDSRILGRDTE